MGEGVLNAPTGFTREDGALACDGVSLDAIAAAAGTPSYVYSAAMIRQQYRALDDALADVPHRLHYSVKANSNLAVLRLLQAIGAGVDIVSGGELHRARLAGFGGDDVVFSGVGKSAAELAAALDAGVRFINVESEAELELLAAIAEARGVTAPVALRVNPEVVVDTPHEYTRTGGRGHKFGIAYDDAIAVASRAMALRGVELVGLDMHIGSQIARHEPYDEALGRVVGLVRELRALGATSLRFVDVGGGLGVTYDAEAPADVGRFAAVVGDHVRDLGVTLVVEPGRFIVANAGLLLTRVLYRKHSAGKEYVITDAGMNDLVRPSIYKAFHGIEAVAPRGGTVVADVVGPVCESGDFFALNRPTDDVLAGDLVAIRSAGAYGYVMSSNYNSRPRAAEVMVDGGRFAIVTERESYDDLVRRETHTPTWRSA